VGDVEPRRRSPLAYFVLLTALSVPLWVLGGLVSVEGLPKNGQVTEIGLAFMPFLSAAILTCKDEGLAGLGRLVARAFDIRRVGNPIWFVPILALLPAVYLLSYGLVRLFDVDLPEQQPIAVVWLPVLVVAFYVGAAGEELGYLGYAVDPMQRRWGALKAGLLIGSYWALWHVPALVQTGQTVSYIAWGLPAAIGLRILIIWIYNNTGRSVAAGILVHVTALVASSYVATSASTPLTVLAAVVVVLVWGPRTLTRHHAGGPGRTRTRTRRAGRGPGRAASSSPG
jgi:uncharacterized protein